MTYLPLFVLQAILQNWQRVNCAACYKRCHATKEHQVGTPMSIRLAPDLKAILQELANADERSLNSYINRALWRHVDANRKLPKAKSGDKRLQRLTARANACG
jgi:hypothetical protein